MASRINQGQVSQRLHIVSNAVNELQGRRNIKRFLEMRNADATAVRNCFTGDYYGTCADLYSLRMIADRLKTLQNLVEMLDSENAVLSDDILQEVADAIGGTFDVTYSTRNTPGGTAVKRVNIMLMQQAGWQQMLADALATVDRANDENETGGVDHGAHPQR